MEQIAKWNREFYDQWKWIIVLFIHIHLLFIDNFISYV